MDKLRLRSKIANIRHCIFDKECIFVGVDDLGNTDLTAQRINPWQWNVETETYTGIHNTYKLSNEKLFQRLEEILEDDPYTQVIVSFKPKMHTETERQLFLEKLTQNLWRADFNGFKMTAEGTKPFVVERHPNHMEWLINGKVGDFLDVLKQTELALRAEIYWNLPRF